MAKREYNNVSMEVARFAKNKTMRISYDGESLVSLLGEIPFDKISIPLYSYRCSMLNNDILKGNVVVGYIEGYNRETDTFNVVIHEAWVDKITVFKDAIIYPRVQAIGDTVTKVLGFDICPKTYYMAIR